MEMKFRKTGYDLRPHGCSVTAPPAGQVTLAALGLGIVALILLVARPGAIDGPTAAALAFLVVNCLAVPSFFIARWYRKPRYRLSVVRGCLDEGASVRVQFEQVGRTAVDRLAFRVICYNPKAVRFGAPEFEREYSRKFSSEDLRRFDGAPAPSQGILELTVPCVKEDGRAWGIRVDFVVRGKARQEFFAPPECICRANRGF